MGTRLVSIHAELLTSILAGLALGDGERGRFAVSNPLPADVTLAGVSLAGDSTGEVCIVMQIESDSFAGDAAEYVAPPMLSVESSTPPRPGWFVHIDSAEQWSSLLGCLDFARMNCTTPEARTAAASLHALASAARNQRAKAGVAEVKAAASV